MKHEKKSVVLILIVIFFITIDVKNISAENINELVLEIHKTDMLNINLTKKMQGDNENSNLKKQYENIKKRYADIDKRFDCLGIDEKLQVLKMVRQSSYDENGIITFKENDSIILDVIDEAAQLAAKDGIFILELTDEEMKKYVQKVKNNLTDEEMIEYFEEEKKELANDQRQNAAKIKKIID